MNSVGRNPYGSYSGIFDDPQSPWVVTQVKSLDQRLAAVEERLGTEVAKSLAALAEEVQSLGRNLGSYVSPTSFNALDGRVTSLQKEVTELRTQLKEREDAEKQLQQTLKDLQEEVELMKHNSVPKEQFEGLSRKVAQVEGLKKRVEGQSKIITDLQQSRQQNSSEAAPKTLEVQFDSFQRSMQDKMENMRNELSELAKKVEALAQERQESRQQMAQGTSAKKNGTPSQPAPKGTSTKKERGKPEVDARQDELACLQGQVANLSESIGQLQTASVAKLKEEATSTLQLSLWKGDVKKDLANVQSKVTEWEVRFARLAEAVQSLTVPDQMQKRLAQCVNLCVEFSPDESHGRLELYGPGHCKEEKSSHAILTELLDDRSEAIRYRASEALQKLLTGTIVQPVERIAQFRVHLSGYVNKLHQEQRYLVFRPPEKDNRMISLWILNHTEAEVEAIRAYWGGKNQQLLCQFATSREQRN